MEVIKVYNGRQNCIVFVINGSTRIIFIVFTTLLDLNGAM